MGVIRTSIWGSFSNAGVGGDRTFSAMEHGHAAAVERAIDYLQDVLTLAIDLDMKLAKQGEFPEDGFGTTLQSKLEDKK